MKQKLEEAVNSISGVHPDWSRLECFRIGFKEGAEWRAKQSPWISVKERLPEEKQRVLVVRNSGLICESCCNLRNKSWLIYGFGYVYDVVVWMPIPSFDEILEANRDVLERIKEKGD